MTDTLLLLPPPVQIPCLLVLEVEADLEWLVEQHPGCMEGPGASLLTLLRPKRATGARWSTLSALRRLGVP